MKVLLIGCLGKMGKMMAKVLEKENIEFFGIDIGNRQEANGYGADVIVDFSSHECLKENLEIALEKRVPIVVATTNHSEMGIKAIENASRHISIFMASNFSYMFSVLLNLTKGLKCLAESSDFVVIETHHKTKRDKPSGSCKSIISVLDKFGITPEVHSCRAGDVVGIHTIMVYSNCERLVLTHEATSREAFCLGALRACRFILHAKCGLYSMQDLDE